MKNSEPTFFRRFSVFVTFSINDKKRQMEPIDINLGFSGRVDPDSGMILNLSEIDTWINIFKKSLSRRRYQDRWDFCKLAHMQLRKQIARPEFTQAHFEFHDLFVNYIAEDIFFGWKRHAQVKNAQFAWTTPVKLTLKASPKFWPPLSALQSARWQTRMHTVDLRKKWRSTDAQFHSFEYTDVETELKIRITSE